jgi:hypothetical protein
MNFQSVFAAASVAAMVLAAQPAAAAIYTSATSQVSGGTLLNFEGQAEGTLVSNQFAGVTFGQTPSGRPQIDNLPQLFGYGPSSGVGVLTGSTEGGNAFDTIAGINATFTGGHNAVEFFFSDTAPIGGAYPITFYGSGGSVLGSLDLAAADILPPGYSGGIFPTGVTSPLPGLFIGFTSAGNDIFGFSVGPSASINDSFAIDDVRWTSLRALVPEPSTWAMLLLGFGGLGAVLRRGRRAPAALA